MENFDAYFNVWPNSVSVMSVEWSTVGPHLISLMSLENATLRKTMYIHKNKSIVMDIIIHCNIKIWDIIYN